MTDISRARSPDEKDGRCLSRGGVMIFSSHTLVKSGYCSGLMRAGDRGNALREE